MIPLFLEPQFEATLTSPRPPFRRVDPANADLSATSLTRFLKLVNAHDLTVQIQATKAYTEPTFYLSKTKTHAIGDVKAPGIEMSWVFVTATNLFDFGVQAAWGDGKFTSAFVGGQKSGNRPAKLFTQITKLTEEIKRCLT